MEDLGNTIAWLGEAMSSRMESYRKAAPSEKRKK